jgi:hypothetical protein
VEVAVVAGLASISIPTGGREDLRSIRTASALFKLTTCREDIGAARRQAQDGSAVTRWLS